VLSIQCGLTASLLLTGKPGVGVGEAGGVVVVGSLVFPVGAFSFAMSLLDS